MRIDAQVDPSNLILRMRNGERRILYAVVNSINATTKRIQQAEFENARRVMQIRNDSFFFGSKSRPGGVAARLGDPPDIAKRRMYREVYVGRATSVGSQRRLLFPVFEEGGTKEPRQGSDTVAVPITGRARQSWERPVARIYTFAGMRLTAHRGRKKQTIARRSNKGRTRNVGITLFDQEGRFDLRRRNVQNIQWKGRHRTFLVKQSQGLPHGGVLQRTGPKRGDVRVLWKFTPSVDIDRRLGWRRVAKQTADRWYREEMEKQVIDAIAHDRGRSQLVA